MSAISPLKNIHLNGQFGDYEGKDEKDLLKITEKKDLLIVQIVQYKNSTLSFDSLTIDGLKLINKPLLVSNNDKTRILWNGPKNWLLSSTKVDLIRDIEEKFNEKDFAVTNLSHSKAIIEIEGKSTKEVLKKGCPFNFNDLNKDNCLNSTYNGMSITVDMLGDTPDRVRIFSLRSFGESLYESLTDASLEFGYIGK
ncbi:sarcosine oxidase [Candidatus Pelagibacter sp.]|nr:sarcosine oxidase [Candidatus Pelagibacter sp.]